MKKLITALFSSIFFLSLAVPTFAAKVCPGGPTFAALCDLSPGDNTNIFQNIFSIMLILGIFLSVVFLIYGGLKWIVSGGDKGKVDAARGTITAAVVGLIIAFMAFFIVGIVSWVFNVQSGNGTVFTLPRLNQAVDP